MNVVNYVYSQFKVGGEKSELSFKYQINDFPLSAYLYRKQKSKKLFVILNGALEKKRETSLVYHRYSWHPLFDGDVLYIADPTLFKYTDLFLAWYMGDKYTPLYEYLVDFVLSVASNLNIQRNQIVFYGSSGGGFTAIQLASHLSHGAVAVGINPQTNILEYYSARARECFLARCFSASLNDYEALYRNHRFNAIENIKLNNTKVLLVQNEMDIEHVKHHFEPAIKELGVKNWEKTFAVDSGNTSRVQVLWYSHESGHGAEQKDSVPEIMKAVDYMINEVK
ncbi:hypothetical protein AAEX37_02215 [Oligella sp. MSHR50489EDL]|uniref:alpha/beta hydrolase family protein n=1 Tax=Oligella sp. MSHR50489EDL TaxID=3139409 RepID=UPI003D816145